MSIYFSLLMTMIYLVPGQREELKRRMEKEGMTAGIIPFMFFVLLLLDFVGIVVAFAFFDLLEYLFWI